MVLRSVGVMTCVNYEAISSIKSIPNMAIKAIEHFKLRQPMRPFKASYNFKTRRWSFNDIS